MIEGLAVYVETWSYREKDRRWFPGKKTDIPEFTHAKDILAAKDSDFKLADFVTIDNEQFHKADRSANYALSGALVHFFMHYDDEVYKEDFMCFISAFYGGRINDEYALADYIHVEGDTRAERFKKLEKQFRDHVGI